MARKKAPRPHGTGGVSYYEKRGMYLATAPRSVPGRPTRWFRTQTEAQDWLTAVTQAANDGMLVEPQRVTVSEFVARWLATKEREVRANTHADYKRSMDLIPDEIGKTRIHKLAPGDVERLLALWHAGGVSDYLRRKAFGHFKQMLRDAMRLQVIPPRNPADAVRAPKYTPKPRKVWTAQEAARFTARHAEHPLYPYVHLALTTPLRRSELLGLKWEDIGKDRLTIQRAVTYLESKWDFGEPKTPLSQREVILDAGTVAALEKQRENVANLRAGGRRHGWEEHDLVFPSTRGTPMSESNLTATFHAMCREANVAVLNLYGLRHTGGTLAFEAGVNPKLLSQRMGHSTVAFTQQRYVHPSEAARKAAALTLEQLTGRTALSVKRQSGSKGVRKVKKKERV